MISPTASACKNVHQVTEMTKNDKQVMNSHGIACVSKDVYSYKEFRYDRLEGAVRFAEIEIARTLAEGRVL